MKAILVIGLIAGLYKSTEGCICTEPLYDKYLACRSDFLIKTRVISNMISLPDSISFYKILPPTSKHIYKFKDAYAGIDLNKLYTANNGSACGVSFLKDTSYVISGLIDEANKRLTVNLCNSWIEEELGGVIYSGTKTLLLQFKHNLVDCLAEMLPLNVNSNAP